MRVGCAVVLGVVSWVGDPALATAQSRAAETVEVIVQGASDAYDADRLPRSGARRLPGAFGDPMRAIEAAPGVTPTFSGLPFFFVRGAPPGNVGFFLDGIEVPMLYHALLGPSVIHPALIDGISFHRGAAPARYGGFAGAVVAATTRAPRDRGSGEANLRIFDAGGLAELPVAERGSVLLGGRYSFTALAASLVNDAELAYWDYQGRAAVRLSRASSLQLMTFGAYDRFESDELTARGGGAEFHRAELRHRFQRDATTWSTSLVFGYDRTAATTGSVSDKRLSLRTEVEQALTDRFALRAGAEGRLDAFALDEGVGSGGDWDVRALFPEREERSLGAYLEAQLQPASWLSLAPGVRADTYRVADASASAVDLRFACAMRPSERLRLVQTLGTAHQPPNFVPQVPAARVGSLEGGLMQATQASSGIAYDFDGELSASVTAFRSQFENLVDPIGKDRDLSLDSTALSRRTRGSSIGLELELRRPLTRRVGGLVAYTLSRSERSTGRSESLSGFDRTHVLQAALGLDLGARFHVGARFAYSSGLPARLLGANASDDHFDGSQRAPGFARLDLRGERRFALGRSGYWSVVLEVLNVTAAKEVTARTCTSERCVDTSSGPVTIPSLGVELYWL